MNATRLPIPATDRIRRTLARVFRAARRRRLRRASAVCPDGQAPGHVGTFECTTFIRIWVDADALHPGSADGIHVADNRSDMGSRLQGTSMLSSCVRAGGRICWEMFNISPTSDVVLRIRSITTSALFAPDAQPRPAPDNADAYTAIATHPGSDTYAIAFDVIRPGQSAMRFRITPTLSVLEHNA